MMLRDISDGYEANRTNRSTGNGADSRFQAALWVLWAFTVVATGYFRWRADVVAERPVDLLGLVIYSILAALIGLVVMTIVEQWLEPQRFID